MTRVGEDVRRPSVVALGMFDGLHIGHRAVIQKAVETARQNGWQSVAFTFSGHPRAVFACAPRMLMTPREKEEGLIALGVDVVDMVPFDEALARLSPEAFLQMLAAKYELRALVAGSDFTFGYKGAGSVATLRAYERQYGFVTCEVPFVMLDGQKVSSSRIREAIEQGNSKLAGEMLGR